MAWACPGTCAVTMLVMPSTIGLWGSFMRPLGCGTCEEEGQEEGSCLLMHPCSCSRAQLSRTAPSKARLEHRMGLTSLGCSEQLSPPPLAAAPTEPLHLPRRWGSNAQRGPALLQAHLGSRRPQHLAEISLQPAHHQQQFRN